MRRLRSHFAVRWAALGPWGSDAVLYGCAATFAVLLALTSNQTAQLRWGYLSAGPYILGALLAVGAGRRLFRREHLARLALLALVGLGTVVIPLALEVRWRDAQPEVGVIQRSGAFLSKGQDPYRTYDKHGRLVNTISGRPAFESFFPYFPLMGVFGLPSAATRQSKGLTDARIVMTLMTLAVSGAALALAKMTRDQKLRVAQVLLVLPTGALFLATGGDDMPILALSLLGVAALQRRQSNLAGISFGLAAAMKLTAWPIAAGALLVARDHRGVSTWKRVLGWMGAIILVTTIPFLWRAPAAFVTNVFAFPLGLAGVASPAASDLPGHLLTTWVPALGHVLAPVTLLVGSYFVTRYARRHWPLSLSRLLAVLSVSVAVVISVASATRIGYVIYPINFALWSAVTAPSVVEVPELVLQP